MCKTYVAKVMFHLGQCFSISIKYSADIVTSRKITLCGLTSMFYRSLEVCNKLSQVSGSASQTSL